MLYDQSYYFIDTPCICSFCIVNAVLPYLQTSATSHPHKTAITLHSAQSVPEASEPNLSAVRT
jgi:hypothetical protein